MNECGLPIGLAVHCNKFKTFNHLLKHGLVTLRGRRRFGVPATDNRGKFLKRTIEVSSKNQEVVVGDMFDTILERREPECPCWNSMNVGIWQLDRRSVTNGIEPGCNVQGCGRLRIFGWRGQESFGS